MHSRNRSSSVGTHRADSAERFENDRCPGFRPIGSSPIGVRMSHLRDDTHSAFGQLPAPLSGDENTGNNTQPQSGEVDPADDLFERLAGNTACDKFF
jgi:hypothetical protein